jgi:hypothetical protein
VATCVGLIRLSSGQQSALWGTVSAYHVLWDPILLTGCTYRVKNYKKLNMCVYLYIYMKSGWKLCTGIKHILVKMEIHRGSQKMYTHFKKGKNGVALLKRQQCFCHFLWLSCLSHGDTSIHLISAIFWANILLHIATVIQFGFEK